MNAFQRYWLFQIPDIVAAAVFLYALVSWGWIGSGLGWLLFVLWVIKDAAMYPLLKKAYEAGGRNDGAADLLDRTGTAVEDLTPIGYVRVRGELWRAHADDPIDAGQPVRVYDARGLTLYVRPEAEAKSEAQAGS